jgi:ankyrin repeat protein
MLNKYRFKINYKLSGGSLSTFKNPFEKALQKNELNSAKLLIEIADINSYDRLGNTYLFYAINSGNLEIVKLLIEKNAQLNNIIKNNKKYTALNAAIDAGHNDIVDYLKTQSKFADFKDDFEKDNTYEIIKLIKNEDINSYDIQDNTYLLYAIKYGRLDIVQLLVQKGAQLNNIIKNDKKYTALHAAVEGGHTPIVEFLINYKQEKDFFNFNQFIDAVDKNGNTALHGAVYNNNLEIVEFLINNSAGVNIKNNDGNTALHLAISSNSLVIIKILIENGADENLLNNIINFNNETKEQIARLKTNKYYEELTIYLVELYSESDKMQII